MNAQALASFIWSIAELLRGDYKQSDYGKVILPFTVLRRLDCVLEPTKGGARRVRSRTSLGSTRPLRWARSRSSGKAALEGALLMTVRG